MGRYRKLLVAVDGSDSSVHALRESFKLATNEKSWITVVSVIPPYEGDLEMVGIGNVMEAVRKPCEIALREADELAKRERALIKTVCEEGVIHERIVDLAEAENCDLIVMARRGKNPVERALVGSVTARVIGTSQRDVLVIPEKAAVGWQKILVATDGSKYSRAATERAIDFARSYCGELKVLSVVDVPAEFYADAPKAVEDLVEKAMGYVSEAADQAQKKGVKAETFVKEGTTYEAVTALAQEQGINVIVVGSHGKTGLKRLLMGSVTEKVIGHASCPVLVIRI
jgi:nucleotide-binding universal stress UspA family protein